MQKLTSFERVDNILNLKPTDTVPAMLTPWNQTLQLWKSQGNFTDFIEYFDLDFRFAGWLNSIADIDWRNQTLEENDTSKLILDGNKATLRKRKDGTGTPEHVDFKVKNRAAWLKHIKPFLIDVDKRRIPLDEYKKEKELAKKQSRFFCWHGVGPFEQMHPVCGHENLLLGMIDDSDWIKDMVVTYAMFTLNHLEELFSLYGKPDGFFFYEDMGFKGKPFMSAAMYAEIIQPGHKLLFDYAHSLGCKVIVHSCGYVEPLVKGLIEAGMNCLQAMEVKAGMNLPALFERFGKQIALYGGIDARTLISNDKNMIEEEITNKMLPVINKGGSYILHSDHSEPPDVTIQTAKFFIDRGREIAAKCFASRI